GYPRRGAGRVLVDRGANHATRPATRADRLTFVGDDHQRLRVASRQAPEVLIERRARVINDSGVRHSKEATPLANAPVLAQVDVLGTVGATVRQDLLRDLLHEAALDGKLECVLFERHQKTQILTLSTSGPVWTRLSEFLSENCSVSTGPGAPRY